jgi:hypothetical protein
MGRSPQGVLRPTVFGPTGRCYLWIYDQRRAKPEHVGRLGFNDFVRDDAHPVATRGFESSSYVLQEPSILMLRGE